MKNRGSLRLLHALKAAGPQTAEALGRKLGMTAVGARQHLVRLQEEALVARQSRLSAAELRREQAKQEQERDYVNFLSGCLGNFLLPAGAPVLIVAVESLVPHR